MPFDYHIVILSYNHPQLTSQTVKSVMGFGFPESQIHLVHNGSLLQHQETVMNEFPTLHHILMPTNKGYSGGANFGLHEVFKQTDSILFLTNDTEVIQLPSSFNNEYDFFSIAIFKRNTQNLDSLIGKIHLKTGHLTHVKSKADLDLESSCLAYIPGTAFGITRKSFLETNGFDESLHTYWEDVELSLRFQKQGFKIGYDDRFQVKHKVGKTCHKDRFYTLFLFQRNRKRILKKYSSAYFIFFVYYFFDMLRILKSILNKPNQKENLTFWWKALYD